MNSNVLEAESRRARRVTHLERVLLLSDFGFRGLAYLQDLSTTGCRVVSESPLQVGMELELSLLGASNERDIEIELAKVRWASGKCFGLEFVAIYPPERERLRLFLKTVVVGPSAPLT
jgi:PilZ domain